jgi:Helix-turn-helix domain
MTVLIDVRTAARLLDVSVQSVHKMMRSKRLRAVRRSPIRFSLAAVERS